MPEPREPKLPSLLPFTVMALILLAIYGGLLLFPTINALGNRQDCVGTGRTDCSASLPLLQHARRRIGGP